MQSQQPVRIPVFRGNVPCFLDLYPERLYKCLLNGIETIVEYGYMSIGGPVCYEPGDSGGGMQSSFFVDIKDIIGPVE